MLLSETWGEFWPLAQGPASLYTLCPHSPFFSLLTLFLLLPSSLLFFLFPILESCLFLATNDNDIMMSYQSSNDNWSIYNEKTDLLYEQEIFLS